MLVCLAPVSQRALEGVKGNHPIADPVLSVFKTLRFYLNNSSHRGRATLRLCLFRRAREPGFFLSQLPCVDSFFFFFVHLGWNISKFAHKWETERIPSCLSHILFCICHTEGIFFPPPPLPPNWCKISVPHFLSVPHREALSLSKIAHLRTSSHKAERPSCAHACLCVC